MNAKILILATLVANCFVVRLHAQEADTTKTLNEVVVSASRFAESRADVPNQLRTITANEIKFQQATNTASLLEQTGQVMVQRSQGGGGSPIIRGFEANKVLIVIDGVRMNNAIFRGGHLQNVLRIDQQMLDRAEIIFGPGSVMYGSDALGGVMAFYSRNPTLAAGDQKFAVAGNASVRYGTANQEKTAQIGLNLAGRRFGSLTNVTISDFGDIRQGGYDNPFSDYPEQFLRNFYVASIGDKDSMMVNDDPLIQKGTAYRQYDILQKFMFQQNAQVRHTLNFQYSNTSDVPRYDRLTEVGGNGNAAFAEWYYSPEKRLLASYRLDLSQANAAYDKFQLITAYQDITESRISRRFNNVGRRSQNEAVQVISLNVDASKALSAKNTLNYGLEVVHNNVESVATSTNIVTEEVTPAATRYPDGGSQTLNTALYLTDRHRLSDKLLLSLGARYSYNTLKAEFVSQEFYPFPYNTAEQKAGALSGNVALAYNPISNLRVSLLGSTGFRTPNVDDLAKVFETTATTLIVPNPDLKPEYAYNGELNLNWQVCSYFGIEAGGFYTILENALGTAAFQLNGQDSAVYNGNTVAVRATQNLGKANISGAYVAIDAPLGKGFSLFAKMNYTRGRMATDTTDIPLDHVAPTFGSGGVRYNHNKLRAELWAAGSAAKKLEDYSPSGEDNLPYATPDGMPAWMTYNLRASYQITRNIAIQAAVDNLLDTNYRVFASGTSAPGRNIIASLRVGF